MELDKKSPEFIKFLPFPYLKQIIYILVNFQTISRVKFLSSLINRNVPKTESTVKLKINTMQTFKNQLGIKLPIRNRFKNQVRSVIMFFVNKKVHSFSVMQSPLLTPIRSLKHSQSARKITAIDFWYHQSVLLLVDFRTFGCNLNAASYCATLGWFHNVFFTKWPGLLLKYDNADRLRTRLLLTWYRKHWNTIPTARISHQVVFNTWDL